jgi:hypothetical protein
MSVRLLVWAGSGCLLVMVFTHIAEGLHLLTGMGWGLPNSPGHLILTNLRTVKSNDGQTCIGPPLIWYISEPEVI